MLGSIALRIFSFWSGPISWIERLSAASARAIGHELTVFSYEPEYLRGASLDAHIEDAREILPDPQLDRTDRQLVDHLGNHFRLEGLAKSLGIWSDLDVVFCAQLPTEPYIFGWEYPDLIGTALLRLPPESQILDDYLAVCRKRPASRSPFWLPRHKKFHRAAKYWINQKVGRPVPGYPCGPRTMTYFVEKYGLTDVAAPPSVYYPIKPWEVDQFCTEDESVDFCLGDETITVHLWHADLVKRGLSEFPKRNSWLGKKCREFDVK